MADKLTVQDIEVPEGMLAEFRTAYNIATSTEVKALKLALLWLAENPIVPSDEALQAIGDEHGRGKVYPENITLYVEGFQRRMFLKKPDPVPEEVKALLFPGATNDRGETTTVVNRRIANEQILAAVEIGRRLEREAR